MKQTSNNNANLIDEEVMNDFISDKRRYYLSEFKLYDTDHFVTFNIVYIDTGKNEITVAVTNEGKISVCSFGLRQDEEGWYFEYGRTFERIAVDGFEKIEED
ncbi:hypothetical protein FACS1894211_08790 [Clostridia bacterium]|nr:hypothetical protein FACS1894211_08790 [Clostridia bacterium]